MRKLEFLKSQKFSSLFTFGNLPYDFNTVKYVLEILLIQQSAGNSLTKGILLRKRCDYDKLHVELEASSNQEFNVNRMQQIVFLGRSNVGKSTLLNVLVNRHAAFVSNTPV